MGPGAYGAGMRKCIVVLRCYNVLGWGERRSSTKLGKKENGTHLGTGIMALRRGCGNSFTHQSAAYPQSALLLPAGKQRQLDCAFFKTKFFSKLVSENSL